MAVVVPIVAAATSNCQLGVREPFPCDDQPPSSSSSSTSRARRQLVGSFLDRHRRFHAASDLGHDHAFSWRRALISFFAYALLLSDVTRAGLGIRAMAGFPVLAPGSYVALGPFAYLVTHLTTSSATTEARTSFWPYKYDTTSIGMRSVAQFFQLPAWSPCVLYQEPCDESVGLPLRSVFNMVDELVDAIRGHRNDQLTLRTESATRDRLHDFAFPWFFQKTAKRTNQAVYYKYGNTTSSSKPVCGQQYLMPSSSSFWGSRSRRPHSCDDTWTNRGRLGLPSSTSLPGSGSGTSGFRVWDAIPKRLATLAKVYANHSIDFAILDSKDDFSQSGMTAQGHQFADIVVFARVQTCDHHNNVCTTIAVEDYRYETITFAMSAPLWFTTVASMRLAGQAYTWLRVAMLVGGCFQARLHETRFRQLSAVEQCIGTIRTVFLIPSQVVIYGSSLPVLLYMVAHLIDSPATYELVFIHFNTALGVIHFSVEDFVRECAVSMRTVWIVGFLCHAALVAATTRCWSPTQGIPGMVELSITALASLTIFAQFRSVSFRQTQILDAHEVVASSRRARFQSETHGLARSVINKLFFSSTIDVQCLLCGVVLVVVVSLVLACGNLLWPRWWPFRLTITSRTVVPYSAGLLWPCGSLVVSWFGAPITRSPRPCERCVSSFAPSAATTHATPLKHAMFPTLGVGHTRLLKEMRNTDHKGLIMRQTVASRQVQREMHTIDRRSREIDAMVYLVNLAAMTDPITFFKLRFGSGALVAMYESPQTKRCFLLPHALASFGGDIPIDYADLSLVGIVNTKELKWRDLLRCG